MLRNNDKSFGSLAKFFHWTIGPIMIIMLIFGYFMAGQRLTSIHEIIGLTVLVLAICRIIWTLQNKHPKLPANMPIHEKLLAKVVQIALYVCMFGMPLSGWAMSTAFGFTPHIYSLQLPMPGIQTDQAFGSIMENVHLILAWGLVASICLHVVGALKHYFIEKDNVLQSMLPFTKEEN